MTDLVTRARELAHHAHRGHRYNELPYTVHLEHTVAVLERFGITDPELLAAGYLHDVLEDTGLTKADLAGVTTPRVVRLVNAVTDGKGENRRERKERPMKLIPKCHGALELKLADRISNVENAWATGNPIIMMYTKEQGEFTQLRTGEAPKIYLGPELIEPPHLNRMWDYLNQLLKGIF